MFQPPCDSLACYQMIAILAGPKESAADWVVEMNPKDHERPNYLPVSIHCHTVMLRKKGVKNGFPIPSGKLT